MTWLAAYFEEAAAALWRNRMRSLLTMLGMIVGSASIVAVFGISHAASAGITQTFASFGTLPISISVDESQDYPDRAAIAYRDTAAVGAALGSRAAYVEPIWQRTYAVASGSKRDFEVVVSDGSFHNDQLAMSEGRKFTAADLDSGARVCVATADLARKYFGNAPAVGNFIRVNGDRCRIVGVYADIKGSLLNSLSSGSAIVLPYTTFFNDFAPGPADQLSVYPADERSADAVSAAAVAALQRIHGAGTKYSVQNGAGIVSAFNGVLGTIAIGLSAIGAVALLVAGIGITNIMLVSVTERTREIGVRKAIGANRSNIAWQFVIEALVLSIAGGMIGMLIGVGATLAAAALLQPQIGEVPIPYFEVILLAIGFSVAIGGVFGTYPALRAARLDPIEALRA